VGAPDAKARAKARAPFCLFFAPPRSRPSRPPTGPAAPPSPRPRRPPPSSPRLPPPGRPPLLAAGRPPGSPPLSREVPAAVPQSPQPHRREAPALARAVTPARPTPTVCRAALSASAAVSRDGPGSPLHRLSDHPREHRCRAILHFPKNRWGGRDLLWRWSVHGLFPIQCGPHFISGRGQCEIFGEKSRGVTCRAVPSSSPRPSPVPPTDPGLRNRGSRLQSRWAQLGD
jgi:hypothetical protein